MKKQLGPYNLVAELGRGGMGVVYKGYEASLNRYVAIKVLADSLAHDESVKERFLREARSMAALNDPHIIHIFSIAEEGGQTYFTMEFVEGESLGSLLKREGKLSVEQAAKVVHQTALGLASAHDRGVVHRDIKPGNLMINERGEIKIADFGIALSNYDLSKKLTSTGEFVGTPGYLSPEVCLGKPVDQRSDIFALGIVLFEMLTGKMPFSDDSPLGLMLEVVRSEIPDVRQLNGEVDSEISRILTKMIAKAPADRYQTCHQLATDLGRHPILAKGGLIMLKPQVSAAAATLIGQKAPLSNGSTLPVTTPAPNSPHSHQSVLERDAKARAGAKQPAALWAIAATLVLGVMGSAYAYRDRIPVLSGLFGNANASASAMDTPATSTSSLPTSTTTTVPAITANTETANSMPTAESLQPDPTLTVSDAEHAAQANPTSTASVPSADNDAGGPASPTLQIEGPVKELGAARTANDTSPARLASIDRNQSPPISKSHTPTVAIIAAGDSGLAEPAQEALTNLLQHQGFHVMDSAIMPGMNRFLYGDRPDFGSVLAKLNSSGKADAVVFVHARPIGSQEITYYGEHSTLYTAQLTVKVYNVKQKRLLGSDWNQQVSFTSLNATDKAREAMQPMLDSIQQTIEEYRPGRRRG